MYQRIEIMDTWKTKNVEWNTQRKTIDDGTTKEKQMYRPIQLWNRDNTIQSNILDNTEQIYNDKFTFREKISIRKGRKTDMNY